MADILLVGDERARAVGVRSLLRQDGHAVTWLQTVESWREVERERLPELIVAPVRSAAPVLSARGRAPHGFPAPILLVQGGTDLGREVRLEERIVDRIESPFGAEELLARVDAWVRVRRVILWGKAGRGSARAADGAPARRWRGMAGRIAGLLSSRVPRHPKPPGPYLEVAARVAEWADHRDAFEPGHAERVASFSAMIADGLSLPDDEAGALLRAAMLHDIGKIALPVEILRQRGPLEEDQYRLVRTHPERGAARMRALDRDEEVALAILYHHERSDGKGYYGMRGDAIPRASRILAVAETFDAMTTSRVRQTLTPEAALERVRELRGVELDPECVDALLQAMSPRPSSVPLSPIPGF